MSCNKYKALALGLSFSTVFESHGIIWGDMVIVNLYHIDNPCFLLIVIYVKCMLWHTSFLISFYEYIFLSLINTAINMGWNSISVNRADVILSRPKGGNVTDDAIIAEALASFLPCRNTSGDWRIDFRKIWFMTSAPWIVSVVSVITLSVLLASVNALISTQQRIIYTIILGLCIWVLVIGLSYVAHTFMNRPSRTKGDGTHPLLDSKQGISPRGVDKRDPVHRTAFRKSADQFMDYLGENGFGSRSLKAYALQYDRLGGAWSVLPVNLGHYLYLRKLLVLLVKHFKEVSELMAHEKYSMALFDRTMKQTSDIVIKDSNLHATNTS